MKSLGKLRCKVFGCGPWAKHRLDEDFDLYVCECCEAAVVDAPALPDEQWRSSVGFKTEREVWYDEHRDQARTRLG